MGFRVSGFGFIDEGPIYPTTRFGSATGNPALRHPRVSSSWFGASGATLQARRTLKALRARTPATPKPSTQHH